MKKNAEAFILGIVCVILTMGICVQIRTVDISGTTTSSNKEINSLKKQVLKEKEKYDEMYAKIEASQKELEKTRKNVTNNDKELKSLEESIDKYHILSGATEVKGQGVRITMIDASANSILSAFCDPSDLIIHYKDILEIVNELKNLGAEAIEVNGQRIVDQTAISCDGNVIAVNGEKISSPIEIKAIGFPERMAPIYRKDGNIRTLEDYDIKTTFDIQDELIISKFLRGNNFKYAKKVN